MTCNIPLWPSLVSWSCRMHQLPLPSNGVLYMTLNYLMIKPQSWSFGECSVHSLPLLPIPLWSWVVVPIRVPSMDQIELLSLWIFGLQSIFPSVFFRYFMLNSEHFIQSKGLDCSYTIDPVQVLSYRKYSVLFLSVVRIEPATCWWFLSEALSNLTPYPLRHVFLSEIIIWRLQVQSQLLVRMTRNTHYLIVVNRIGTVYPCRLNKGFSLRFCVGTQVWHIIQNMSLSINMRSIIQIF